MYRLFSRNTPLAYAAMLLILIGLRGRMIYDPARFVVADTPDLFSPLWTAVMGHIVPGSTLSLVMVITVTFLCALIVNNIVNRHSLSQERGALGGLFFIILCGGFRLSLAFQPCVLFALALIWGVDRLFSATNKTRPYASVAWGFGIVSIGCLFWAKGLCFLPFLLILMSLLRIGGGRSYTAAFVGVAGVAAVALTLTLSTDSPLEVWRAYVRSGLATQPYWRLGPVSITYLVIELGITLFAVMSSQRHLLEMSITASRKVRAAEWMLFYSILLTLLPGFSCEIQILVAIGASMLLPRFVSGIRNDRVREAIPLVMTAAAAWLIYI